MMDHHFPAMATATGRTDWLTHPRFGTSLERRSNSDEYVAELSMEFRKRPTAEWLHILRAADIPCGAVHEPSSLLTDAHLEAVDLVVELNHPSYGAVRGPRSAARFGRSAASVASPAPILGEHTRELLADLGLVETEIDALFADGVVS
jgi:crotonobetainyl-CoA:carnitine CoA-transferase CaiB-like acyl-CoA transferase